MASSDGKENIADGLVAGLAFKAPSPKKSARKTRSKSIGPGGIGAAVDEPALKESSGNRRKSAFIPAVKSILSSNDEEEKKRREARRKSLARRRVSFAPEATLHTWDVVEYLRDATSSTASSEATRRASSVSRPSTAPTPDSSDAEEPPSTPPKQIEEPEPEPGSSPASQRDLHQTKIRRRSSGIPPMNFNNPEDMYSSSPLSGGEKSPGRGDDITGALNEEDPVEPMDNSLDSNDSSQSSAKLDAALQQAAAQADTQKLDLDEDQDMSMELAEDEITASFKPWASKPIVRKRQDQNAIDPFSFAPPPPPVSSSSSDDDMSMDITRAVGKIMPQSELQSPDLDDITMDLTLPLGSIQQAAPSEAPSRKKSLKRRVSALDGSQGSPAKRPASRRTSLRQRPPAEQGPTPEDETMELTVAIGEIKSNMPPKAQQKTVKRLSTETSFGDETMDFTVAVGGIQNVNPTNVDAPDSDMDDDEDLSMEFTTVIGGIKHLTRAAQTLEKPMESKSPTPKQSHSKSPARPKRSSMTAPQTLSPLKMGNTTPKKSPGRPIKHLGLSTPKALFPEQRIEDFEPSPFVRSAPQSASRPPDAVATPLGSTQKRSASHVSDDPIAAPILNRRRSSLSSVQFSPLTTSREEPTLKSTTLLTNNIKLLSTPRKQTLASPMKRSLTPKQSQTPQKVSTPKQKTPTPKKATPRKSMSPVKRVMFGQEPEVEEEANEEVTDNAVEDVERVSLQDFLDMTKIRFMDLSTTKRRHTAAPAAFHDREIEETEESLDRYVVAAACTLPEFELYQHACHEMKKYISDGRHFVRTMEANVQEENPLLFSEYLTAPPDQRVVMDNQFKNLKTNARLDARGEWYGWRSSLLRDLKAGLIGTMDGFKRDESVLADQEELLDSVLPPLVEQQEELDAECKRLQQRHDELNSCDREELEQVREQLVAADVEIAEKRRLVSQLEQELVDKESRIGAVKERKIECVEEIKAAERMREECRGWSTSEVYDLKVKVTALEQAHGWSISSASSTTITMTHMNDLELYFQPSAFVTSKDSPNASISLAYVGDTATPHPRPLTTSKRFFLQLIRAQLHCIPQSQTRVAELLALVKNGWATALAVAEGVRWLEHTHLTEELILSDERMAIAANMLLPALQTKVKITFEIAVSLSVQGVNTEVAARAELVYGEKYSEDKMAAFLRDFVGAQVKSQKDMAVWADAVVDLAARLKATGRKGERT